jgi:hypothetical protein
VVLGDTLHVATRFLAAAAGTAPPPGALVRWRALVVSLDMSACGPIDPVPDAVNVSQLVSGDAAVAGLLAAATAAGRGGRLSAGAGVSLVALPAAAARTAVVPVYLLEYTCRFPAL